MGLAEHGANKKTGWNIRRTLLPTSSGLRSNRSFFCQSGSLEATDYRWRCGADATEGGTRPLPLSFCMRDGWFCRLQIDSRHSKKLVALIRNLGRICFPFSALDKIPVWTPWTRCFGRDMLRSLKGAFRLQRHHRLRPTGPSVSEALGCCFLLMCLVLGAGSAVVYLTGKIALQQVHGRGRLSRSDSLCPNAVYMSSYLRQCLQCLQQLLSTVTHRESACNRAQVQCSCGCLAEQGLAGLIMSAGSASASVSSTTPNGTPLPAGPPPARPVNEAPETSLLREASQRVATKLADALSAEGVYVNRIKVELPARYLDITRWNVQMDHLGERAAWQEHPNTIFMDSESDGEDAAEMPVFEATEGSEGGSGGPLTDVVAGMESTGRCMMTGQRPPGSRRSS